MAVTVIRREPDNRTQNLLAISKDIRSGILQKAQLKESEKSGKANRAYQEAIGDQAKSTTALNKHKLKVMEAHPEEAKNFLLDSSKALKNQVFMQKAHIDMLQKSGEIEKARATQAFEIQDAKNNAMLTQIKTDNAKVFQAYDTQLKKSQASIEAFKAKEVAEKSRLADERVF